MEKTILIIVLLVAIVGVVGLFSSYDFSATDALGGQSLTGNVVASQSSCGSCAGYAPVCARINTKYRTYENACEAVCGGASVAANMACEQLPQAN